MMKIEYNWEEKYTTYTCAVCGYKHMEKHYDHPDPYTIDPGFGKKPFKQGLNKFIYMQEQSYGPDCTIQETVYACPKCGVLQIESENRV